MPNSLCDKNQGMHRSWDGGGGGCPLYDPRSELHYFKGESSASITINEIGRIKEVKCIPAAVIIRYPNKLYR